MSAYRMMRGVWAPLFSLALMAMLLVVTTVSHARMQTFEKEYTYTASELDSKLSCRAIALEQVKRLLMQELGVYVESAVIDKSSSDGKTPDEVRQEITTLTAGVASAEVVAEKWDGQTYWMKARVSADPDDVAKKVDALRENKQQKAELEDVRQRAADLTRELDRMRNELAATKDAAAKAEQAAKYNSAVRQLSATDWFEKAYAAGKAGYDKVAVEWYTKSLDLDPNNAVAYNNRGNAYSHLGDKQRALLDFGRSVERDPQYAAAYYNRGLLYYSAGDVRAAIEDYSRALEADPQFSYALNNRGVAYKDIGEYQRALADLDRVTTMHPRFASAYCNKGLTYSAMGNYRQAIKEYDRALLIDPSFSIVFINRGYAYLELGDHARALDDYNSALALNPQDPMALNNRGVAYWKMGKLVTAEDDFKAAARLGYKDAQEFLTSIGVRW